MYIAELKGKIPADVEKMEDILTSNVFSFFKYSKRDIYLKMFLSKLDIIVTDSELNEAEFIFWPTYNDGTEPDVVILVGGYYLLFESKYYSDFGRKTATTDYQLIREAEGGLIASQKEDKKFQEQLIGEAKEGSKASKEIEKKFYLIAITADYYYKPNKFEVIKDFPIHLKWINWQTVAEIILNLIEEKLVKKSI